MISLLVSFTTLLIIVSLIFIGLAPVDSTLGVSQKIFYFHASSGWVAALAFLINFIGSFSYLIKRDLRWDRIASSSAEIGVVFGAIVLVTGSTWAKFAWGIWWTWDVRLTTTLILWLAYVGYMLVRMISENDKRNIFSAVIGIVAFANLPLVFLSIRWWRSIHPAVITRSGIHLDTMMMVTFFLSLAAMTLFYICMLTLKMRIERLKEKVEALQNE